MTRRTIIGDGLAIFAGVTAVMATEATWGIVVSKIIGVRAPGQTHVGENVAQVDIRYLLASLLDQGAPRLIDLGVIGPIEIVELFLDALLRHVAGAVIYLENLDCLFLDVRQLWADATERHLLVDRVFGQIEGVRGPVVAIHTIHHAMLALVQLRFGGLGIRGNEFRGFSLIVGVIHGRDGLPLGVGGNVLNARVVGEVTPVDADGTLPRASAYFQQQDI